MTQRTLGSRRVRPTAHPSPPAVTFHSVFHVSSPCVPAYSVRMQARRQLSDSVRTSFFKRGCAARALPYPLHMSILITYTSALEVMRLPEFPELAAQWNERTGYIPEKLPTVEELERILDSCPPLRGLSRPLHLLVSSDNNSHSSRRVVRHVRYLGGLRGWYAAAPWNADHA